MVRRTAMAESATPPPHELARWLARMVTNGCSHGVVEVSSQALATRQLVRRIARCGRADERAPRAPGPARQRGKLSSRKATVVRAPQAGRLRRLQRRRRGQPGDAGIAAGAADHGRYPQRRATAGQDPGTLRQRADVSADGRSGMRAGSHADDRRPVRLLLPVGCRRRTGHGIGFDDDRAGPGIGRNMSGPLGALECGQDFSVFVDHAQTPSALAHEPARVAGSDTRDD